MDYRLNKLKTHIGADAELKNLIKSSLSSLSKKSTQIIERDLATMRKSRGIFRFLRFFNRQPVSTTQSCRTERIVAGMATMPSRMHTFNLSFSSLIRQVDHLYLYLDGHQEVPAIAQGDSRVTPVFAKEIPNLHANGKFIGLKMEAQDCIYICADDDIYFTFDFVKRMREALALQQDRAIVGLHAARLVKPFVRYNQSRKLVTHYNDTLDKLALVDTIGTGAAMFASSAVSFDVEDWPRVSMADLGLSIEAAKKKIPLYSIERKYPLVATIEEAQADSLYLARKKEDTLQTKLCKELLGFAENH